MSLPAAFYRWYVRRPDHPAKRRVERLLARGLPSAGTVTTVSHGVRLRLHPRDWIEYTLLRDGEYEPLTLTFLEANLRPGDRAVLAGVNFGLHVVVASRAVGETGLVVGVDPQMRALVKTADHLRLNGCASNTRLVPAALSRTSTLVVLDPPPEDNSGMANLRSRGHGPFCATVATLPWLWAELAGPDRPPRVALLDVEGFEGEVLGGFGDSFRPELVIVEEYDEFLRAMGSSRLELRAELVRLGYRLASLTGQTPTDDAELPEHNIVAIHERCDDVRFVTGDAARG